jgi:hypothetical protein
MARILGSQGFSPFTDSLPDSAFVSMIFSAFSIQLSAFSGQLSAKERKKS